MKNIRSRVRSLSVLLACLITSVSASATEPNLVDDFKSLSKSTRWKPIRTLNLQFQSYHPQGMTIIDDHIYISSVHAIKRKDGIGKGYLFKINDKGNLVKTLELGEGARYHPGGIDFDGEEIWVSVAEYKPDSSSIVYAVDPAMMKARKVFEFPDHLGAIAHDPDNHILFALSWGSRRFYTWPTERKDTKWSPVQPSEPSVTLNPNHYIDYQDCQIIRGTGRILCSGLNRFTGKGLGGGPMALGGIDLISIDTMRAEHMLPIPLWAERALVMTNNPFFVQSTKTGIRLHFAPQDNETTIYIFEALDTPRAK